jgi:hypothetical protein
MNKKLFLLGVLALLLTVSNVSFATNDAIDERDNDADEMHAEDHDDDSDDHAKKKKPPKWDIKDTKGTANGTHIPTAKRKTQKEEFKDEKKELRTEMKEAKNDLRDSFRSQVDSWTLAEIKALKDTYKSKFETIKNDTTKTDEEKKAALKVVHDELDAKIKALLPTDLQDDFATLRANIKDIHTTWKEKREELKQEWKNTKDERKAKREERRENMQGKMHTGFTKLDTVLTKFESKKTPDELITTYTNLLKKLDTKLATMDSATEMYLFLKNIRDDLADKIEEIQAS